MFKFAFIVFLYGYSDFLVDFKLATNTIEAIDYNPNILLCMHDDSACVCYQHTKCVLRPFYYMLFCVFDSFSAYVEAYFVGHTCILTV